MKKKLFTLGLALAFSSVGFAASVIDFEELPEGPITGGTLSYTVGSVPITFSALGLFVDINNPLPGNHTLHSESYYDPITVTFGGGFTADFIEIRNVFDTTSPIETDIIIASAYSASGTFLGSVRTSDSILRLGLPGTASVIFDDVDGTAFTIDDFRFHAVSEPSSLTLLAAGVVLASARFVTRRQLQNRRSR